MKLIKVLVVDDQPLIAEGLKVVLGPTFKVCWLCRAGETLFDAATQLRPDIIALGTSQSSFSGLFELHQLRSQGCSARLVILTSDKDPNYAATVMQAGATAFLLKHSAIEELRLGFLEAAAGRTFIASGQPIFSANAPTFRSEECPQEPRLTKRQREVLRLFAEGYSAKDVARILSISKRTAENHKAAIKRMTDANSTAELVRLAIRLGLISPP
jgi:DNA-binding NarL/FixJ family response regulator